MNQYKILVYLVLTIRLDWFLHKKFGIGVFKEFP